MAMEWFHALKRTTDPIRSRYWPGDYLAVADNPPVSGLRGDLAVTGFAAVVVKDRLNLWLGRRVFAAPIYSPAFTVTVNPFSNEREPAKSLGIPPAPVFGPIAFLASVLRAF